jgi:hypothetical protein
MYDAPDLRVIMPQARIIFLFDITTGHQNLLHIRTISTVQYIIRHELKCMYSVNVWQRCKLNNGDNDGYDSLRILLSSRGSEKVQITHCGCTITSNSRVLVLSLDFKMRKVFYW